ncbi:TPA: hypothetical protein ACK21Z_003143 [Vibrio harveyi]
MAILCDFDLYPDGITPIKVTSAYWRILEVNTLKSESLVRVGIFRDSASSSSIGLFVFSFSPDFDSGNYHEQAYNHLKQLAPCLNAVDA